MKNSLFKLLAIILAFFSTNVLAQCIIPITQGQSYIEDFESGQMECWTTEATGDGNWSVLVGSVSSGPTFQNGTAGDEARLISPTFDLSEVNSATFSFSYAMIGLYSVDELEVGYRTSESDSWHVFDTYSFSDVNNFYEASFDLPDLSATYQVSFLARCHGGYIIIVDNVEITGEGGCIRPTNLNATEITANSALLGWSTTGGEESWVVELNGNEIPVETQPYLIEELLPLTDYTFRVKAICGEDFESDWATPITFTTTSKMIVVTDNEPFFDDFEASSDFIYWQNDISSGDGGWVIDPGYTILNNTAFFIWLNQEALLYSTPMDITAVTNPTLEFKHKQPLEQGRVDQLMVAYRTSPDDSWHILANYEGATDNWETVTLALPDASAEYQIGFNGISHNANGIYVDDVRVGNGTNVGVVEITEITDGNAVVYDMFGRIVASGKFQAGRPDFDINCLASGVYIVRISNEQGVRTMKIIKE